MLLIQYAFDKIKFVQVCLQRQCPVVQGS